MLYSAGKLVNQHLTILVLLTFIGPVQANSSGYTELKVVDTSPYWVTFESPSQHALSMTWAADTLWLSDLFTGVFYKTIETANGLAR